MSADTDALPKHTEFDYELNPYYTSASVFFSISDDPIPHLGEMDELVMRALDQAIRADQQAIAGQGQRGAGRRRLQARRRHRRRRGAGA